MPANITRVTVNLPTAEVQRLKNLAHNRMTTVTNVIRGAIDLELFITGEEARGGKLLIHERNGTYSRVSREIQSTKPVPPVVRASRYKRDPVI